ncbi:cadherin-87A isoform X2 [Aplysia californica]|uniref:Cadherin-87A isoform X2 n=1 Tax=Aplysia californica TaxID=6500 RepID=A0ABM0ZUF7_APLCA|nr:cadherin-87A isoform X2 [Aplysia californica]
MNPNIFLLLVLTCLGGKVSSQLVTNVPEIKDYSVINGNSLPESTAIGTVIGTVVAVDPDGTEVSYFLFGDGAEFFNIDQKTGIVTLKKLLDFEKQTEIKMLLKVEDGDLQSSEREGKIFVDDVNDEKPEFRFKNLFKEISEGEIPPSFVSDISVTDLDTSNSLITVTCSGNTPSLRDACNTFSLTQVMQSNKYWNGTLNLVKELDYEKRKSYVIQLKAYDGIHEVTDEVHIEVKDVNDSPPQWQKTGPKIIDEEISKGTVIQTVTASDPDVGAPRPIVYELFGDHMDVFTINSTSGEISNIIAPDFDAQGSRKNRPWDVTIRAREVITNPDGTTALGNDPLTTATVKIRITMKDINDNAPKFDKNVYNIEINENIARGQNIPGLQMTVTDADQTDIYNSFRLATDNYTDIFQVIPTEDAASSSPTLYVADPEKIDYESGQREYRILVTAKEYKTIPALTGSATVIIKVRDVNDEDPKFDKDSYTVSVFEDARGGTSVIDLNAKDREEGDFGEAGIRYSLYGNTPEHFEIDRITGLLTVKDCLTPGKPPCIDYERKKRYVLTVAATDNLGDITNGRTRSVQVIVNILDVNDNFPRPEASYLRYILEGNTVTVNPLIIEAVDPDTVGGPIVYTIEGSGSNLWQITQGVRPGTNNSYANITATRGVLYSDAPDKEKGQFTFTVVSYDQKNKAVSQVTIIVIDINNNAPEFTSPTYKHSMSEQVVGETYLLTVTAKDLDSPTTGNGVIDFAIQSGAVGKFQLRNRRKNPDDTFSMDIRTTQDARFSFETQNEYKLILEARDRGTPTARTGTATLTVSITDANNKSPVIKPTSQTINVREDTPIGRSVHKVTAEDPDVNKKLRFFMEPDSGTKPNGLPSDADFKNMFTINAITGVVTVNQALNRDQVAFITNELTVQDQGANPVQEGTGALFIRITEYNDQDPYFVKSEYRLNITEETIRNSFVESLQCKDDDDDIASYSLEQIIPNFPDYFGLLGETGTMIVNDRIDYEKGLERITLVARCADSGTPRRTATASVFVDVININDNTPQFNQTTYTPTTSEANKTVEEYLTTVAANDLDRGDFGVVFYQLNDPDNFFRINNQTGQIFVKPNARFDREKAESYVLQVIALDSPNNPDVRRQTTAQVIIRISDTNDNCPDFGSHSFYSGSVPETATRDTNILDIIATDLDSGLGGEIMYAIKPGSFFPPSNEDLFRIWTTNNVGRLLTKGNLKNKVGTYNFTVTATDMKGDLSMSPCVREVPVSVVIQESQNNAPEWIKPPRRDWVVYVLESQYEGMLVYDAKAKDENKGPNGIVNYYFIHNSNLVSNTSEFRINRVTGVIRAEVIFDREKVDRYFLTLLARDSGNPSASSETTLTVMILDVDDNDPRFRMRNGAVVPLVLPETPVAENVPITTQPGRLLGNCSYLASDADSNDGDHNRIYYELLTVDVQDYIEVNQYDCKIYLKKQVDYEQMNQLAFDILAYNLRNDDSVKRYNMRGDGSYSSRAINIGNGYKEEVNPSVLPVVINIGDSNDNPPVFSQSEYLACASIDTPYMRDILEVSATDRDLGDNSELRYSIKGGSREFDISGTTGIIRNLISFRFDGNGNKIYVLNVAVSDGLFEALAKATVFITEESNIVRIKVNRPLKTVENIQRQLVKTIVDSSDDIQFACISSMRNHINGDGEESILATDVMLTAMRYQGGSYTIHSAAALATILEGERTQSNSAVEALYVTKVEEHDEGGIFNLDEDAVLAILIICILLIFLALLLLCIACYCIRRSKNRKKKKLNAQRNTIISVSPEPVETSFNPVYSNHGFESTEYATVKKVQSSAAPVVPVVIPAPEDLQPLPGEEPTNLEPYEPEEIPPPVVEPEGPVPIIETEVVGEPASQSSSYSRRVFEHPEYEDKIETIVVEGDSPGPVTMVIPGSSESQGAVMFAESSGSQGGGLMADSSGSQGAVYFAGSAGGQGAVLADGSSESQGVVYVDGSSGSHGAAVFADSSGSGGQGTAMFADSSSGGQGTAMFADSSGGQGVMIVDSSGSQVAAMDGEGVFVIPAPEPVFVSHLESENMMAASPDSDPQTVVVYDPEPEPQTVVVYDPEPLETDMPELPEFPGDTDIEVEIRDSPPPSPPSSPTVHEIEQSFTIQ